MKFSVNYQSKHKKQADEIRCPIEKLGYIYNFIKENPEKRILVQISNSELNRDNKNKSLETLKAIVQDYTIECSALNELRELKDQGYNAFLRYPVADWETFLGFKKIGVSDIYIDGPLGFAQDKLALVKDNLILRTSPTISPNASLLGASPQSFFVRPEDLSLLTTLDLVDFKETDQEREDTLFEIYKRGSFLYELDLLVRGRNLDVLNPLLSNCDFGETRLNCGQRCLEPGRSCHFCERTIAVAKRIPEVVRSVDRTEKKILEESDDTAKTSPYNIKLEGDL